MNLVIKKIKQKFSIYMTSQYELHKELGDFTYYSKTIFKFEVK